MAENMRMLQYLVKQPSLPYPLPALASANYACAGDDRKLTELPTNLNVLMSVNGQISSAAKLHITMQHVSAYTVVRAIPPVNGR